MSSAEPICVGFFVDAHFVNKSFVWCGQELSYCHRLRRAIDSNMRLAEEYRDYGASLLMRHALTCILCAAVCI